jgi:hypothetical protein
VVEFGGGFVGGMVCVGAFVTFGRAVAGGLLQDRFCLPFNCLFSCLFFVESLLLHLEVVLLVGWSLLVHLSLLAELLPG